MSKWKDTAPTKVLGGGKKTKKLGGGDKAVAESIPETVNLRQEEGAMGGVNLHLPNEEINLPVAEEPSSSSKTVFFRPKKSSSSDDSVDATETPVSDVSSAVASGVSSQPIIGWLVITKGSGKGNAIPLHYGLLKIGRDANQDVALDFGDNGISRINHASIEFDKKTRQFFLSKGENLVYLNGERVGQGGEKEIHTGDEIEIGDDTVLRFVSFCGPDFDWND